ncbi:MAG: WD40 repeat [Glomeribacter sp. 1016415]|nr:WD40 repeat [Glomeribacter sp. 1016415]
MFPINLNKSTPSFLASHFPNLLNTPARTDSIQVAYDAEMQSVTQISTGLVSIPVSGSNHQVEVHYHGTGLDLKLLETLNRHQNLALHPNTAPLANLGEGIETMRKNYLSGLHIDEMIRNALSLYVGPEGRRAGSGESGERFDLKHKLDAFLKSDKKVFLLLGEAGSGKSTFNRYLARVLWERFEQAGRKEDERLPVFISLATLDDPNKNLLTEYFTEEGFSKEQIQQLRQNRRFIFILDGYDEIKHRQRAFYTDNKLDKWDAKVVISSRPEYLGPSYQSKFHPSGQARVFEECELAPFSKAAIKGYVESHVRHAQSPKWNVAQYESALSHPDLQALIGNPFLLKIVLDVLPSLGLEENSSNRNSYTRTELYEQFAENWFGRSKERLERIGARLTRKEQEIFDRLAEEDFIQHGMRFSQDFALALYEKQVLVATYSTGKASEGQDLSRFLSNDDEKTRLLRFNAPLSRQGNQYRFIHKSLRDYFVAREMWQELESSVGLDASIGEPLNGMKNVRSLWEALNDSNRVDQRGVLNRFNLVEDAAILNFLVERVGQNKALVKPLLAWIQASKTEKEVSQGAANAMTILAKSGIQFSGLDLAGIRVPGADLSFGMFDSAQLQRADLTGVKLHTSWLQQANISGAQMAGVQFGEWTYVQEESKVYSCAYSPDGQTCAMGLGNGVIRVYDTSSWAKIHTLEGHTSSVNSVVYSPSGAQIASGSSDKKVRLWDAHSGAAGPTLEGHTFSVESVVYSPSGAQLASGSWDKTVRLWDAHSGALLRTLEGHTDFVLSVVYSRSGVQIASGSSDKTVRLWDAHSGALLRTLEGHTSSVMSVVYSPSGAQIASGSYDNMVRLWDAYSGAAGPTLEGHTSYVMSVVYSPSGAQIASGSFDNTVRLWDAHSGAAGPILEGHTSSVNSVAYSPGGAQIASGSWDKTVRLWDAHSGTAGPTLEGHTNSVMSVVYSRSGTQIASGSMDTTVRLWDAHSGALLRTLEGHTNTVMSVVYSPSGAQIASGSYDNMVRLWDAYSGAAGPTLEGHTSYVNSVVYSRSGAQIASGSLDKTVRLWDAHSGALLRTLEGHTVSVKSVVYSPSGAQIASGSYDKTVRLWDAHSGAAGPILEGHTASVNSVVYSPSGAQLASGSDDKTVRLWDAHSGAAGPTLEGHTASVNSVVYSPSGAQLASGSDDKTVRLWDAVSGECFSFIQAFRGGVYSVDWTELNGCEYLVTGSADKFVRQWELQKDGASYQAKLCWSSRRHYILNVRDMRLEGAQGLSERNVRLLKQRGA